jgi:hypothetical protein
MPGSNQPLSDEEILVKHAFHGSSFAVVRMEELTEIGNLKADAVSCYQPVNAQELFAVEHIAICQQRMLRGYRFESGLFTTALDYCLEPNGETFRPMSHDLVGDGDIEITHAQNRNFAAGEGIRRMVKDSEVWKIMLRYQTSAERQYRRAIEDFERLERRRPQMPNHPGIGAGPYVIQDIAPLREINPILPRDFVPSKPNKPVPQECRPVVESSPEPPAASPESPDDGAPLAPAAASITKTRMPATRIPSGNAPEAGRLKVAPFAPLRRPNNLRLVPVSSARRSASPSSRPACRPLADNGSRAASQESLPATPIMGDSAT